MRDIIVKEDHSKMEDVLDLFKELTNYDEYFEQLFHDTCTAIIELYCISPKAWLDTNATNIGFTKGNIMKYFDIESYATFPNFKNLCTFKDDVQEEQTAHHSA